MKISEIFMAGIFLTIVIFFVTFSIDQVSIASPNLTANLTGNTTNLSIISSYNLTNESTTLRNKLENLSVQSFGSDPLTQLSTAFGLSVFFGIEVIRIFFFSTITLILMIPSTLAFFVNGMDIPIVTAIFSMILLFLVPILVITIVIIVARLFKPDI